MLKRKAVALDHAPSGVKKAKHADVPPTTAKPVLLNDSSEDESDGGADLGFKVNEEYAKRFEHNKKRAELQRLEEKYKETDKPAKGHYGDKYDEDSESSDDEDEDDHGFLATEELDAEISATLQALRQKDPRVYDEKVTFYAPVEDGADATAAAAKEKPIFLSDYHRDNLLKGYIGGEEEKDTIPLTFVQEQAQLKKSVVQEMHAAAAEAVSDDDDDDNDDGFMVPKAKPAKSNQVMHPSRAKKLGLEDVAKADKDPENFLSNFMAARAWVPTEGSQLQPLESDDDEEDERIEQWETAYNLRFEDPTGSNEKLKVYSRIESRSVRREKPNSRQKKRDAEKARKDEKKAEREAEKAQLRRLKVDEMTEKLQKIKKAAGTRSKTLHEDELAKFLEEGYDDEKWDQDFTKHFGEKYYAEQEVGSDSDEAAEGHRKKKARKPKWDDDIDIKDLFPEFEDEEMTQVEPTFGLSDLEEDDEDEEESSHKQKSGKERQKEKEKKKKAARIERKKIEELVDSRIEFDLPLKSKHSTFRYRETSPISFGLTARDILMASDSSLNQFAGLKKLASFRDTEKKLKDKKRLGKKARAKWRKETFGREDGPEIILAPSADEPVAEDKDAVNVNIVEGTKRKRRSRKSKAKAEEA